MGVTSAAWGVIHGLPQIRVPVLSAGSSCESFLLGSYDKGAIHSVLQWYGVAAPANADSSGQLSAMLATPSNWELFRENAAYLSAKVLGMEYVRLAEDRRRALARGAGSEDRRGELDPKVDDSAGLMRIVLELYKRARAGGLPGGDSE